MTEEKKIAFIPIDNRPVCYTLAEQIADIDENIQLLIPPREMLGNLQKTADIAGIINWLKNIPNPNSIIVSLDTIAYGGLIPSRRSKDSFETIKKRMEEFKKILSLKNTKVYAFSSIMRISNNNVNEEEKEYWNLYGEKIFKYSFESHKKAPEKVLSSEIPDEILQDYLSTRKRNFEINKLYLKWAQEGFFSTLVFSKDDCAQYGFNVAEAQALESEIKTKNINALIKTGADEIPLSLLTRALTDSNTIKIAPVFTEPSFVDKISKYEDISVIDSVKGQIELAGCTFTDRDNADVILLINNFKEEQGELVMGVDVEGFNGTLKLPQKPFLIADIRNANGADNNFVEKLLQIPVNWENFLGYAAWNTTGNTLGSGLCCAIVKLLSQNLNINAFKKVQTIRFLDDWAYQANVRKKLKSYLTEISVEELKKQIKIFEKTIQNYLQYYPQNINYSYPWNRFFEIEISIEE